MYLSLNFLNFCSIQFYSIFNIKPCYLYDNNDVISKNTNLNLPTKYIDVLIHK